MMRIKGMVRHELESATIFRGGSTMHNIGIKWEQWGMIVTRIHGFNDDNMFKSEYYYFWKNSEIPDFFLREF